MYLSWHTSTSLLFCFQAEIDSLTSAEKETQQLVRELDIAQSQVRPI